MDKRSFQSRTLHLLVVRQVVNMQYLLIHNNTVAFETFLAIFQDSPNHQWMWWYLPGKIYSPLNGVLKL